MLVHRIAEHPKHRVFTCIVKLMVDEEICINDEAYPDVYTNVFMRSSEEDLSQNLTIVHLFVFASDELDAYGLLTKSVRHK